LAKEQSLLLKKKGKKKKKTDVAFDQVGFDAALLLFS
jgi:hypothetical protein